ncbi:unnamed protein product [Acanthocheilonema viteae]|uniref:Thioredoxin domain-containing protein n=1 Tax=Acanthocheilonema viteae TaxID=6277 RepID=A0A498SCV5_ACAVI|nr:unnamed protein product [Acanthocheilonema viteae]
MDHSMEKVLGEQLLKVVTVTEEEVDRQIEKYDNLDENDLEAIRRKRLQELKKRQLQKQATTNERCKIVDKHLRKIAPKYLETRFIFANAEKFPFLTTRLKIRVIPTIIVIIDAKTVDYIRGFDDLGGNDEFRTETLEWRLSWSKVIEYNGPSYLRDSGMVVTKVTKGVKKKVRRNVDDDDDEW